MKKKILTVLMAVALILGNTTAGYGATYNSKNLNSFLKGWTTYFYQLIIGDSNSNDEKPENDNTQNDVVIENNSKASQILSLVNQERQARGLAKLTLDAKANKVAQVKAEDMAKKGYFSHTSPTYGSPFEMLKYFGVSYKAAGENIAKGQKTAQSVMNGWMNSQGHKANILNSNYTKLGVGYAVDANGTPYWVQMFIG